MLIVSAYACEHVFCRGKKKEWRRVHRLCVAIRHISHVRTNVMIKLTINIQARAFLRSHSLENTLPKELHSPFKLFKQVQRARVILWKFSKLSSHLFPNVMCFSSYTPFTIPPTHTRWCTHIFLSKYKCERTCFIWYLSWNSVARQ